MDHDSIKINPCSQYRGNLFRDIDLQVDNLLIMRTEEGSTTSIFIIAVIRRIIECTLNLEGGSSGATKILHHHLQFNVINSSACLITGRVQPVVDEQRSRGNRIECHIRETLILRGDPSDRGIDRGHFQIIIAVNAV